MATCTVSQSVTVGGVTISGSLSRDGYGQEGGEVTLDAGNAGSLTTRTDDNTGVITADSADHDIASSDVVDVYWGSGSTAGIRRGMTATVSGTAISVDGGAGDNLPVATTDVVVDKQATINMDFTGSEVTIAGVCSQYRSSVAFQEGDGTAIFSLDLGKSGNDAEVWTWTTYAKESTPFSAAVGRVKTSNGDSENSNTVTIGVLLNNLS